MNVDDLRKLKPAALERLLLEGHIDPAALEGWAYRGTALAMPRALQALTWQTFQKTFHRLPDGRLVGWNVRLEQDGVDAPSRPKLRGGAPRCVWPYEVLPPGGVPRFERGLVIDYGPFARGLDSMRFVKDPLVALDASGELLLGVSDVVLGPARVRTPTWFVLQREHPIAYVPPLFEPAPALRDFERRWAEALFDALLGVPVTDRERFWTLVAAKAPALVKPGLRVAVHALTALPTTMKGYGRPFFALPWPRQLACVEAMGEHPSLTVKQLVSTLKVLACFALLEAPGQRERLTTQASPGDLDARATPSPRVVDRAGAARLATNADVREAARPPPRGSRLHGATALEPTGGGP